MGTIIPGTAEVVVTCLASFVENRQEQAISQKILFYFWTCQIYISKSIHQNSLFLGKWPAPEPFRYCSRKVFNSTMELNLVNWKCTSAVRKGFF